MLGTGRWLPSGAADSSLCSAEHSVPGCVWKESRCAGMVGGWTGRFAVQEHPAGRFQTNLCGKAQMTKTREDLSWTRRHGTSTVRAWPWSPRGDGNNQHSALAWGHGLSTGSGLAMVSFCNGPRKAISIELGICLLWVCLEQQEARPEYSGI